MERGARDWDILVQIQIFIFGADEKGRPYVGCDVSSERYWQIL